MTVAINPLPSLLHSSATDAANMQMRKNGRSRWNDDDLNVAIETQNRLVRSCFGRENDPDESMMPFFRCQIARSLEEAGEFNLSSDMQIIHRRIDEIIETPA